VAKCLGHLHSLRRALPDTVGVRPGAVTADHLQFGVLPQPSGDGRRGPVGQEVDHRVGFQVDQDGAEVPPLAARPIVDAQDAHRTVRGQG